MATKSKSVKFYNAYRMNTDPSQIVSGKPGKWRGRVSGLTIFLGAVSLLLIISSFATAVTGKIPGTLMLCVLASLSIGFTTKSCFSLGQMTHGIVTCAACIFLLSSVCGFVSYFHTFLQPKSGLFVGDGWRSVVGAAMWGGLFAGVPLGLISTVTYCLFEPIVGSTENKTAGP